MVEAHFQPDWFSKPGDTLAVLMHRRELSVVEVAALVGRDVATIQGIISGFTQIDSSLAKAIAGHIGGSVSFWLRRQEAYEAMLRQAAERVPSNVCSEWLRVLPQKEIAEATGANRKSKESMLEASMAFFGVNGPNEWQARYAASLGDVAFRQSKSFVASVGATTAWLRQGELQASAMNCGVWSAERLRKSLSELRSLVCAKSPSYYIPKIRSICAAAGVAVVFVPSPPGCRASGAARFISDDRAMICLSLRYKTDDHFWFTLFHEIGHLLLHSKNATFIDVKGMPSDEREEEANRFAAELLVPADRREELARLPARRQSVLRLAVSLKLSPGVVVGQAQYAGYFQHKSLNYMKRSLDWDDIKKLIG